MAGFPERNYSGGKGGQQRQREGSLPRKPVASKDTGDTKQTLYELAKEVVKELQRKMDVNREGLVRAFAEPHRALGNSEAQDKHEVRLLLHALID